MPPLLPSICSPLEVLVSRKVREVLVFREVQLLATLMH